MAIVNTDFNVKEKLQPGARGEIFQANLPGYRDNADRLNRTNMKLNTSDHDVLNTKYMFDYRLPVLFKYGFSYGFNQIVIPKGRMVAADPAMDMVDFDSQKQFNTLTLANGGMAVRIREIGDQYSGTLTSTGAAMDVNNIGKEWIPVQGYADAVVGDPQTGVFRPFSKNSSGGTDTRDFYSSKTALEDAGYEIGVDGMNGRVSKDGVAVDNVRPGNIPLGMIERSEHTRDDDAFNGMMPGPIITNMLVELPMFATKDKADQNPFGSIYGALSPGTLVKSDENGRLTVSPLSNPDLVATMSLAEYEAERQQLVGQVYSINHELVPEGAAKWATWALADRLNSEEFNPAVYKKTNRRGEDAVEGSPFNSNGTYPGYPYDRNYLNNDLHMLASIGRKDAYDPRMNPEYMYSDLGIPGLTDGYNVAEREIAMTRVGSINKADSNKDYIDTFYRTTDVNMSELKIQLGDKTPVNCVEGAEIDTDTGITVSYANMRQGLVVLKVTDRAKADSFLGQDKYASGCEIKLGGKKRGLAGVPTFMDWDGCIGSAYILLQK